MVVSWIGINDVRVQEDVDVCMTQLFEMAEMMYLTGARHFIYITVPPLNRTPAGTSTPVAPYFITLPSHPMTPFPIRFQVHH